MNESEKKIEELARGLEKAMSTLSIELPYCRHIASFILTREAALEEKLRKAREALRKIERAVFCGTQMDHKNCGRCISIEALKSLE